MKRLAIKYLLWALSKLMGYNPELERIRLSTSKFAIPDRLAETLVKAKELCLSIDGTPYSSGWKRTLVLTKLVKSGVSKRDAALAIELAVRDMR